MTLGRSFKKKITLSVLLACLALVAVLFIKSVTILEVEVVGLEKLTKERFLSYFDMEGINSISYYFYFKEADAHKKIPFVGKYDITLRDRHTIFFEVYENEVIACVNVMGNYFEFDKEGTVLSSSSERPDGIPVVKGLEFDEIMLFEQLSIQRQSMFDTILQVVKLLHEYDIPIEEISFNEFKEITFQTGDLTVQIGKREDYDVVLSALSGMYDEAVVRGGTLDLRNYTEENKEAVLR